jgi:hypothetical protein
MTAEIVRLTPRGSIGPAACDQPSILQQLEPARLINELAVSWGVSLDLVRAVAAGKVL